MLHIRKLLAAAVIFFCSTSSIHAQVMDSILNIYSDQYLYEKAHLHFDKALYNKGETIWFKAYLMAGSDLSYYSKNFYADWYDASGKLLSHTVSPIFRSSAKGQFVVPANYTGSTIHVRAYTQWMLNFDSAFLFDKDIAIYQPDSKPKAPVINKTTLDFFPEGGNIIEGLTNRIAFKAVNQNGLPVYVTGAIKNSKNVLIDSFAAEHDGMGSFSLDYKKGETYHITWIDEFGKTTTSSLPTPKPSGVVMSVQVPRSEQCAVLVERTPDVPDNEKTLYLAAHMNHQLVYKSRINFSIKTSIVAEIPTTDFPTGVLQITLFNSEWRPIAERVVFVNNYLHQFNTKVEPAQVSLSKRGKNVIEFFVSDTALTNMSVAITDADVATDTKTNIYSDLLLSGEVKGYIHNPAYYFSSDADSVEHNRDLVLLTHGWRRYNWDEISQGKLPTIKFPKDDDYLQIKGKVFGNAFSRSPTKPLLNLIVVGKDSSKQFIMIPVGNDGSFDQRGIFFFDTVKLYYTFNGDKRLVDRTDVTFSNGLFALPNNNNSLVRTTPFVPLTNWNDSLAKMRLKYFYDEKLRLEKLMASTTLQEVIVRAKTKSKLEELDEKYANGLFSGGDGYQFDVGSDVFAQGAMDVFMYLQGRVPGLQINYNGGQPTLSWRNSPTSLFLDEMQAQPDQLQSIPMTDIAYIKVFRPPFFGATGGAPGGAIAVYTKRGNDGKRVYSTPGMPTTILGGYTTYKEFYSPNYANAPMNSDPDLRTTLYWNPYLMTDKRNPRTRIEFYNNDVSKKLRLVLEGMNADGKMTRVEKILE
ncbi:MAG: hypothetical protein KGO81_00340 [Bacteroidota bacterium]|nr:hypothetical protein [Bacteroidota bacterium]